MNSPPTPDPALREFFVRLRRTKESLLLLDFDGTLAPFVVERSRATMYPGVARAIGAIQDCGMTRVVIVSGRTLDDLLPLVALDRIPEVWGSHGLERRFPDGARVSFELEPALASELESAATRLIQRGLGAYCERKTYGIALHWRGIPAEDASMIEASARSSLIELAVDSPFEVLEFSAGIELRLRFRNKGDAVRELALEVGSEALLAYLGDDTTDEDAFRAVNATSGLSVLVRSDDVASQARVRLVPPQQLLAFLERWRECLEQ